MTGGFPLLGSIVPTTVGASASTSLGTQLTNPVLTNTKGAYTQIIASTAHNAAEFTVSILCGASPGSSANLFDIAIGGSGAEVVIVPNLMIDNLQDVSTGVGYTTLQKKIGIPIPAGTRIAARFAANTITSLGAFADIVLGDGGFTQREYAAIDAIGVGGSSRGTGVISGGSNALGSWSQLVASASYNYIGFFLSFDLHGTVNTVARNVLFDIGLGASGSEQVILKQVGMRADVNTTQNGFGVTPQFTETFMVSIPAGSRIAARCQSSLSSDTLGIILYGLR